MNAVKSLRIPSSLHHAVRVRARRERIDVSTAMRQLMLLGAREYALQLYREGRITLREAAEVADLNTREMLESLWEHGVRGNVTLEEERTALTNALSRIKRRR